MVIKYEWLTNHQLIQAESVVAVSDDGFVHTTIFGGARPTFIVRPAGPPAVPSIVEVIATESSNLDDLCDRVEVLRGKLPADLRRECRESMFPQSRTN